MSGRIYLIIIASAIAVAIRRRLLLRMFDLILAGVAKHFTNNLVLLVFSFTPPFCVGVFQAATEFFQVAFGIITSGV